jgi:putative N-acetylmannosamine-6-phosphate epimerase
MPERPGTLYSGSLNVFAITVASRTVGGSVALRMHDVQLAREIQLDKEWPVAGIMSWSG